MNIECVHSTETHPFLAVRWPIRLGARDVYLAEGPIPQTEIDNHYIYPQNAYEKGECAVLCFRVVYIMHKAEQLSRALRGHSSVVNIENNSMGGLRCRQMLNKLWTSQLSYVWILAIRICSLSGN